MIAFNEKYNEETFVKFLEDFLPEDFAVKEKDVSESTGCQKITDVKEIGYCESLDLTVLEMSHNGNNDPRVTIATDAFKILKTYDIQKALVVFKVNDSDNWRFSYLTISLDIDDNNQIRKRYSNPRRYSFYMGSGSKIKTPTKQLVSKGRILDSEDLLSRFSVEVVNKEFYLEIAKYFDDLVSDDSNILTLPSQNSQTIRKSFAVRLIGRLMFCWFLKQKKSSFGQLIPDDILSSEAVCNNYYHETLERLFFEVLNTNIDEREIRTELFDKVPYLNGGLFNPQKDDYYEIDKGTYASKFINTLKIKDEWFQSFFELLETYNFTIDENTVIDQELSVDPEMLGRIFENLLAEINPETENSERKRTGSFYTPRQIVEHMVDESLLEYLLEKTGVPENKLEALISYDLEDDLNHPLTEEEKAKIVSSIDSLKIIDPACGSGAYPIGLLQKSVYILQTADPDGVLWRNKKLENIPEIYRQKIESDFDSRTLDYLRKLEVIKNSIFGVDIQPIAVEVSRLRCFLTLVVEEEIDDSKKNRGIESLPNLDFKFVCANTLVRAPEQDHDQDEKLFSDDFQERLAIAVDKYFSSTGETKRSANNSIHTLIDEKVDEQMRYINSLISYDGNKVIETAKAKLNSKKISENSRTLNLWDSYKNIFENKVVKFFDPVYFFPGVKEGFDIVIGNPPYVSLEKEKENKDLYKETYKVFSPRGDLYCLFYERGVELLKPETGILSYITSNKWMRADYGSKLRSYFLEKDIKHLIDFGGFQVFESAGVDTNIILLKNNNIKDGFLACHFRDDYKKDESIVDYFSENAVRLNNPGEGVWFIGNVLELNLKNKIEESCVPLKKYDIKISYGIKTGFNEAFIIDEDKKNELVTRDSSSSDLIRPILRGRDVRRYGFEPSNLYIIVAKFGSHSDIEAKYPAIYEHLKTHEIKLKKRGQCQYSRSKNESDSEYPGQHHWLELDNNPSDEYLKLFDGEKIIWPDIMRKPKNNSGDSRDFPYFCLDNSGTYQEATNFIMTGKKLKLLIAILNSKAGVYFFTNWFAGPRFDNKGFRYKKTYLENFLIPRITSDNEKVVSEIEKQVDEIQRLKMSDYTFDTKKYENNIDSLVMDFYELTKEERVIIANS